MRRNWSLSVLVSAGILCLSAVLFFQLRKQDEDRVFKLFYNDIEQYAQTLENETKRIEGTLKHWQSLYSNISYISPDEFQRVVADVLKSNSSLEVVAWSPIVAHAQRANVEKQLGRPFLEFPAVPVENDRDLRVFAQNFDIGNAQPVPQKDFYLPILVAEPANLTDRFLGLDYLTMDKLGYNLDFQRIVQSGQVTALPIIPSVFSKRHEPIIDVVVPVLDLHQQNKATDVVLVRGIINAIIPVDGILSMSGFGELEGKAQLKIRDISDSSLGFGLHTVYVMGDSDAQFTPRAMEREFTMFGRKFVVLAQPTDKYIAQHTSWSSLLALIVGALITLSYLMYALFSRRRALFVDQIVERRTKQLVHNNQQLNEVNLQLEQLSKIDPLTGIENRRAFDDISKKEWMRARRDRRSLVVLMIDVDHFKSYNDTYGHLKGDDCLQQVAQCIDSVCSRSSDLVARYGGEEFAVILPSSGPDAMRVAERCRAAVSALKIEHKTSASSDRVTISIGMSSVIPSDSNSLELLVDSADRALYLAKVQGRNRVIYHTCLNHSAPSRLCVDDDLPSRGESA